MGFGIKYERVLLITAFVCFASIARANPGFFLPLDEFFYPGVNAYVDTDPAIGSVSTWKGSVNKTCANWSTDAIAEMCLGTTYDQHHGTDYNTLNPGQKGYFAAPVYAAASGIVAHIETGHANKKSCGCFGNFVKIDHGDGWETIYGHLDSVNEKLKVGMWIPTHEFLGNAGNTGASTGDHVHFEVRHNGQHIDPYTNTNVWCGGEPQFYNGAPCDSPRWHPAGTIVHVPGTPEYYRIGEDGLLRHIINEDIYFANGYTWEQAIDITVQEKACYPSANTPMSSIPKQGIIMEKKWLGLKKVFWFYHGSSLDPTRFRKRIHAHNAAEVAQSWGLTLPSDDQDAQDILDNYNVAPGYLALRNGALFKVHNTPEIYVMENGKHRWVTDWDTFAFAGYAMDNVLLIEHDAVEYIAGFAGEPLVIADFTRCMIEACTDNEQASVMLCPTNTKLDEDGDGMMLALDCNDHDPKIANGFEEECDELDNNCNTLIDENGVCNFWIAIEDDDDPPSDDAPDSDEPPIPSCQPAQEQCGDGIDNDCDGIIDNGCGPCGGMADGTSCNDQNACTAGDACFTGVCWGSQITCDDGNMCTDDECDPQLGCVIEFNTLGCTPDGNPCTHDICSFGVCTHPPMDFLCDDGNPCTHEDTCQNGVCVGGAFICECITGNDCMHDDPCMSGSCVSHNCVFENVCVSDETDNTDVPKEEEEVDIDEPAQTDPPQAGDDGDEPIDTPEKADEAEETSSSTDVEDTNNDTAQDKGITITWSDPTLPTLEVADLIGCVGLNWDGLGMQCNESEWTYTNLFDCLQTDVPMFSCNLDALYGRTIWFNIQFFPAHDYGSGYLETYVCGMNGTYTGKVNIVAPENAAVFTSCEPDENGNYNMMLTLAGDTSLTQSGGLLENGSFEMGVNGWFPEIHEWEEASMTLDCSNPIDGYCAHKTEFKTLPNADYAVQLVGSLPVTAGKQYKVSFAARAHTNRVMRAWLGNANPPYNTYGLNHTAQVGTEWATFTFVFTALKTDSHAKLGMVLGSSTSTIWLDAISVTQITP